jgi:polysaccharide biosynthesis protein PslG
MPADRHPNLVASAFTALAIVLLVGACGSSKPAGPGEALSKGTLFGFNEDATVGSYSLQAELGMQIRRFPVAWGDVERAPGVWSWTRYDRDYRSMRASGLTPLLVAVGAPCWAGPSAASCHGASPEPPDPAHDREWAEYVRRLIQRYPDAAGLEVWNEPNIVPNFRPRPDPARYTQLLEAAYTAAKGVDPRMPVISAGLFASPASGAYGVGDATFLAGMYAAGAKGSMDGIGAHPYPITSTASGGSPSYDIGAMQDDIARLRAVRDAAGASSTPIWITEMGVSTQSAPGFPPGASESDQANDLLKLVTEVGRGEAIPVALIHRLVDPSYDPAGGALGRFEAGFGVFRSDGTPKLAACELSTAFHGSLTC